MAIQLKELIKGRGKPLCVEVNLSIRDALPKMIANDYSQLPLIDQYGKLAGIITEKTILKTYLEFSDTFSLDIPVNSFSTFAEKMSAEDELPLALDRIKNAEVIVIVDEMNRPIGILTDYDTNLFLRNLYEVYTLLEDIELKLTNLIEAILQTDEMKTTALFKAFKPDRRDQTKPAKQWNDLSLHEKVQLITAEGNWNKFEATLNPKNFFVDRIEKVGKIRNGLMHFQGKPNSAEYQTLKNVAEWAKLLPLPVAAQTVKKPILSISQFLKTEAPREEGKYSLLGQWLEAQPAEVVEIKVSFEDIKSLVGDLPPSAFEHDSWWANDSVGHVHSKVWLDAGWKQVNVDNAAQAVVFRRTTDALMALFFEDLLNRLKQRRPGVTHASKVQYASWFSFAAGRAGFYFGWSFRRGDVLSLDLYIDSTDAQANKRDFDKLAEQKDAIGEEIGAPLLWERLDKNRQSRIRATRKCKITDAPNELEASKDWALEMTLKFLDIFQPRIKELGH